MSRGLYRGVDQLVGWLLFVVSSVVYLLTMEPTASFWDCGEFIACADKLIVGHPPGAPFFMLLMRLFTMWAPRPELVGVFANCLSAFASGATIMFLYWSIAYMARRALGADSAGGLSTAGAITVVGAGLVGALCYTFSDTFWFSAVEGEVYALSSLFTAVVFWAILRWDSEPDGPRADRWILLIALLMGMSIGVHLLNLLAIPAIGLVFYFRRYRFSWRGLLVALGISSVLLLTILYGVIQGLVVVASWFELLFVNTFGLPFLSGAVFFFFLLAAGLAVGILISQRRGKRVLNLVFLSAAMLLIGYSSYSVIVIRSLANPTLDQNGADNMFSLKSYLNREQYGDRPLLVGPQFNSPIRDYRDGAAVYAPRGDRYKAISQRVDPIYDDQFTTVFPRMWSRDQIHVQGYKSWVNFKGRPVTHTTPDGRTETILMPTFGENLLFFFRYQVGYMYWRYFMWNFSGRQNDYQGYGHDALRGNWISGIPLLDDLRLGPQGELPEPYKSNKGHNRYYMLPLLLGLFGMVSHFRRHRFDATVVLTLFFLTGIAIVMYLNQKPYEPRERDYTFAASFYAFAIWVGMGVIPLTARLGRALRGNAAPVVSTLVALLLVPTLMARENWDDHDRSGRYISVDFARNMLSSAERNGILFTYADNDTFPLWYAQECEGFRRDVRVCNLTYLSGDWYIDVMSRKAYEGEPIPFGIKREDYLDGTNDVLFLKDRTRRAVDLRGAMRFLLTDPKAKRTSPFVAGGTVLELPTRHLYLPVDSARQVAALSEQFHGQIADTFAISPDPLIYKNGIAMLGLLSRNDWQRPLYYSQLLPKSMYWGLGKYFVTNGLVHAIHPIRDSAVHVDTARSFRHLVREYSYRSIRDSSVYVDETCKRMVEYYLKSFGSTAEGLARLGDSVLLERLLDHCFSALPPRQVDWSYLWLPLIEGYYQCGAREKGARWLREYATQCADLIRYGMALPDHLRGQIKNDYGMAEAILEQLIRIALTHNDQEVIDQIGGFPSLSRGSS